MQRATKDMIMSLVMIHFSYGAVARSAYPPFAKKLPVPRVISGILFGLGIWAGCSIGWLPAVQLYKPTTREPAARTWTIAAHIFWGATLGLFGRRLGLASRRPS